MFEILRKTCRVLAIGTISCLMVNSWSMAKPLELRPRNEPNLFVELRIIAQWLILFVESSHLLR